MAGARVARWCQCQALLSPTPSPDCPRTLPLQATLVCGSPLSAQPLPSLSLFLLPGCQPPSLSPTPPYILLPHDSEPPHLEIPGARYRRGITPSPSHIFLGEGSGLIPSLSHKSQHSDCPPISFAETLSLSSKASCGVGNTEILGEKK